MGVSADGLILKHLAPTQPDWYETSRFCPFCFSTLLNLNWMLNEVGPTMWLHDPDTVPVCAYLRSIVRGARP